MKSLLFSYEFEKSKQVMATSLGLLILRVSVGLMMAFSHGLGKVQKYMNTDDVQFLDPIGLGASTSLLLAGGTELVMSLLLVVGLMTRLACVPLIFTMIVAVFIVHSGDPFSKMEFGLLYLFPYIAIFLMGPGKFSLDFMFREKN